jgi:hypothetical protein
MNPQELRLLQAPLKERYRKDPATALMKFKSQGRLSERISCEIDSKNGLIKAGLHPFAGGDGSLACSADMLLEALIACAGVRLLDAPQQRVGAGRHGGLLRQPGSGFTPQGRADSAMNLGESRGRAGMPGREAI